MPDMRSIVLPALFALFAPPVEAWEFTPTPVCTLVHIEAGAEVVLTYDHGTRLYAIRVTTPQGWPMAPAFSMRFDGPRPGTISTQRHRLDGTSLTVTDAGFGNVLNGLEFNTTATAFTQTSAVTVSLAGAAGPVQKFRACTTAPVA